MALAKVNPSNQKKKLTPLEVFSMALDMGATAGNMASSFGGMFGKTPVKTAGMKTTGMGDYPAPVYDKLLG